MSTSANRAGLGVLADQPRERPEPPEAGFQPMPDDERTGPAHQLPAVVRPERGTAVLTVLLALLALGWTAIVTAAAVLALTGRVANIPAVASWVSVGAGPLALIGIVGLLWQRGSRREQRRFALVSQGLRSEAAALEATLARLGARAEEHRAVLADQAVRLDTLGHDATRRLAGVADELREGTAALARSASILDGAASSAREDIGVLLTDMPRANSAAEALSSAVRQVGADARGEIVALDDRLGALDARAREAEAVIGDVAGRLGTRLASLESAGAALEQRVGSAALVLEQVVARSLDRAAAAFAETHSGVAAQAASLTALVEQSEASLAKVGGDAANALGRRLEAVGERLDALGARLGAQDVAGQSLVARLTAGLSEIEASTIALTESGQARAAQLGGALGNVRGEVEALSGALKAGDLVAGTAAARVDALRQELAAALGDAEERMPAALDRVAAQVRHSGAAVAAVAPALAQIEDGAGAALARVREIGAAVVEQVGGASRELAATEERMQAVRADAQALAVAIADTTRDAGVAADEAAPRLVDAMVRARETAQLAAGRAREAFAEVMPTTAELLAEHARAALQRAIAPQVEAQLASVEEAARRAVTAAEGAGELLGERMRALEEATAAAEHRVETARASGAEESRNSMSRRVALLIESLNSTAIDVTKILSNEVTDSAWAAYLKGDRGVFTRRAVRLIGGGEAREIARHYAEEPEFREQVNRYIHDFEAMLREVLAHRDATPLGVTLLSSDMGKLYVALAQAISRLRS